MCLLIRHQKCILLRHCATNKAHFRTVIADQVGVVMPGRSCPVVSRLRGNDGEDQRVSVIADLIRNPEGMGCPVVRQYQDFQD